MFPAYLGPDHLYIINFIELIKRTISFLKIFGPWLGTYTTHEIYWVNFEKSLDDAYLPNELHHDYRKQMIMLLQLLT